MLANSNVLVKMRNSYWIAAAERRSRAYSTKQSEPTPPSPRHSDNKKYEDQRLTTPLNDSDFEKFKSISEKIGFKITKGAQGAETLESNGTEGCLLISKRSVYFFARNALKHHPNDYEKFGLMFKDLDEFYKFFLKA